jgi:hypothetical protein
MAAKVNEILGSKPVQVIKSDSCFRNHLCTRHLDVILMMGTCISHYKPALMAVSLSRLHQLAFYLWHGFRYSLDPSFPHENCQLSERIYYDLDPYNDILPDRNYDIYSKNEYARSCQEKFPQRHPFAESGMYIANHSSSSF